MKSCSAQIAVLLAADDFAQGQFVPGYGFVPWDLYTINTPIGLTLYYTTATFTIAQPPDNAGEALYGLAAIFNGSGGKLVAPNAGVGWKPLAIDMKGENGRAQAHWKRGLDSDQWQVQIAPRAFDPLTGAPWPDRIGGQPWLAAAAAGLLDDADCVISRAYFSAPPAYPLPPGGAVPVGTVTIFRGLIGEIDLTPTSAILTINDYRQEFQQPMPRNLYQSSCRHLLYDNRCTLSASAFTVTATASGASNQKQIVATADLTAPSSPGSGTFALGTLTMTSGANAGFKRLVSKWDGFATLALLNPLPFPVAAGDTFSLTAGCDKTIATCTNFDNVVNFGGDPFTPIPELTVP